MCVCVEEPVLTTDTVCSNRGFKKRAPRAIKEIKKFAEKVRRWSGCDPFCACMSNKAYTVCALTSLLRWWWAVCCVCVLTSCPLRVPLQLMGTKDNRLDSQLNKHVWSKGIR